MSTLIEDHITETSVREGEQTHREAGTPPKRTLIIPDVHHKHKIAQSIIDHVQADHIIHLGDHQDNFGDTVGHAVNTARWTRDRLDAGDTILLGNHDLPYWFWNDKHDWGCGWTPDKHRAIQSIITRERRCEFKLWVECEGWVLSHAGFTSMYADLIPHHDIFMEETLWYGSTHQLIYHVGARRGGRGSGGGVLWLDWLDLMLSNPPLKQIVGHTPHANFQTYRGLINHDYSQAWNLDTHLHHYGILEGGELTVHEVER